VNRLLGLVDRAAGVHLQRLSPMTTLLVWTRNSLYRIVVTTGCDVYVQGGPFFREPTPAHVDGASFGGALLKAGWIGVGLLMEISVGHKRIVTSPVRAIVAEPDTPVVH